GVDASGQKWAKQISVSFRGAQQGNQKGAAITLTSDPAVVVKTGKGDPDCSADHPYGQQLIVRELNGSAVKLTKFLAGGHDYSDRIASWFGSQTLPASGALQAKLCWQLNSVPVTLAYEMDGVDASGKSVQATLKVDFKDLLDQKSGDVSSAEAHTLSGWPSQPAASRAIVRRGAASPKRTSSGMTVAPRPVMGDASTRQRSKPTGSTGR